MDSIVAAATARSKLTSSFGVLTADHADFWALTVDCVEFQLLTVDYAHIYGSIWKNA